MKLERDWFGANRERMYQELTKRIDAVTPNPLGDENSELGKMYELVVLKTYRALLANASERTYLNKTKARLSVEEFIVWRIGVIEKLLKAKPYDSERMLRINAWVIYHLNATEI